MRYLKNISNWPDPGVKWCIWSKIIHFDCIRVIFLEKLKTTEAHKYAQNITWVLLFYQLWWHMSKTWWPKIVLFLRHKGNFLGKSKNSKTTQICLKYSLRCVRASVSERYLKNNRLIPKTMVKKNLSLPRYKFHNNTTHFKPIIDFGQKRL